MSTQSGLDPKRLLVIDGEENMRHMLTNLLKKTGYTVDTAANGKIGMEMVRKTVYDFILCDMKMPEMDGMSFLKTAGEWLKDSTVIMMSAFGTVDTAIEAMKMGAYDYIPKPFKADEVCLTLKKAEERESLKKENVQLKQRIRNIESHYLFGKMVAKSKPMRQIFSLAEKAAKYDTTVLVTGESGTGKELVARGIHDTGERAQAPMIPVNCGGIPENLLESEFFGFKKGSFTGADRNKKGLFEEAGGGTIFLDEVGELPMSLQVKLLRVLQEREIRQIGDAKTRSIDVRVIAATAKDLEEEVRKGSFRQDLFYRLNVLPIRIPALRERTEDIPLLCQHFIERFKKMPGKGATTISSEAMGLLLKYHWPGNVRELENLIERAIVLSDSPELTQEYFSLSTDSVRAGENMESLFDGYSLKVAQKILEKKMITKALGATDGNRTKASRLLEISHPSLLSKMKTYEIKG